MNDHHDSAGGAAGPPATQDDPSGHELHRRLVARDPVAVQQLWEQYFWSLTRYAASQLHDPVTREDVANDLVLNVIVSMRDRPERYDPTRGKSLFGYLMMDLKGDLRNHFAQLKRRPRIVSIDSPSGSDDDDVGNQELGGNLSSDEPSPEDIVLRGESDTRVAAIRRHVVQTDDEGIVFDLQYVHDERSTDVFANALGILHLPTPEQVQVIQKMKDRLAKRLRRM